MSVSSAVAPVAHNLDVSPPVPATEYKVSETPEAFTVRADLSNVQSTKLGLTNERILTIVGERQGEQEAAVPYQRAVPLPESVDETKITASMNPEGVLSMSLPKKGDAPAAEAPSVAAQ